MLVTKKVKTRKTNKSKSKRQRTFTSSEFSLPEDRNQLSLNELFRNDLLKRKAQPKPNKSQKQLGTTKKRTKSKSKLRLDKCQTYEVIPYKNSLNSEIIFSNEDTKREGLIDDSLSQQLAIRVNQQYLVDSNRQLRISIKKQYQKKVEAAIKIQKVFRGYLTRKILLKYVQHEQKILSQRLAHHRSESVSEHSSYFADKSANQSKRRVMSEQQGVFEYSNQHNNQEEEDNSQQELDIAVYRHHEPIYSQDDISGYLSESEEEDFDEDAFNNHIIFETNEEYIESRKSSGQNQQPKNKLSHAGHPEPIHEETIQPQSQEPPETPTYAQPLQVQHSNLSKTEKKVDRQRRRSRKEEVSFKVSTMKLGEQGQNSTGDVPQYLENGENEATLKENEIAMRKGSKRFTEVQACDVERLKQAEKVKWDEIIEMVRSQITKTSIGNQELTDFMNKIMEKSIKNKEMLELQPLLFSQNSISSLHDNPVVHRDSRSKLKSLKAGRQYLTHFQFDPQQTAEPIQQTKSRKIEPISDVVEEKHLESVQPEKKGMTLDEKYLFFEGRDDKRCSEDKSDVPVSYHTPVSSFENTGQMKKFLANNMQEEYIEEMLRFREDLIKKREFEQIRQLNAQLERRLISQEDFMTCIANITSKYSVEKGIVEKAKEDISKGYQAAMKLTKEAMKDAKKLGFSLPVSRSMEGIRFKSPLLLDDIIIDELANLQGRKKAKAKEQSKQGGSISLPDSDHQSSDLQFTEEELQRFRRAQPYDIELAQEIADMGRNVMISEQLLRQQQLDGEQNILMKTQHVHREIYEIEESSPPPKNNANVDMIAQKLMEWMLMEAAGELLIKPLFSERLIDKNHFYKPKPVSDQERLRFMELLENHFPCVEELNTKLNQKICPLPTELLRCMRIDFSEEDEDDNSYEEIGKYQFIIGQDICNQAIKSFLREIEEKNPNIEPCLAELKELSAQYTLSDRLIRYIEQREKYIANRRNHTKELRWEVLNIQIHCIFDAWNQQLIYLRSQKAGYSGIGLNELTLSIKDHNCLVPKQETFTLIKEAKARLIKSLSQSSPMIIFPLVADEGDEEQLENDSRWIFYADEALSYGLELVYLVEQELFNEMGKQLRKRMLHFFPH